MREQGSPYKVIEEKIQFHRKRSQYHKERADNWDRVLAQIQALQRQEQALGRVEDFKLEQPEIPVEKPETGAEVAKKAKDAPTKAQLKKQKAAEKRADFARTLLLQHEADGILPVDVRTAANAAGISTPTNYPYKIFTRMVTRSGTARKDEDTGRYYPVGVGKKK
jgi:hypothetical protein